MELRRKRTTALFDKKVWPVGEMNCWEREAGSVRRGRVRRRAKRVPCHQRRSWPSCAGSSEPSSQRAALQRARELTQEDRGWQSFSREKASSAKRAFAEAFCRY
jgi:hypothetical protein